jgi:hypothetical protein
MSAHLEPIARVTQRATDVLVKELGVVDTIRFLGQFRAGSGDYTAQRGKLLEGLAVADIVRLIRAREKDEDPTAER